MLDCRLVSLIVIGLFVTPAHSASVVAATPNITGTWERDPSPYADDKGRNIDDPPPPAGDPDLKEPYASDYKALRKRQAEAYASGRSLIDSYTRCLPEGMPSVMGAVYPIQILQNPGQVTVLAEFLTQTRRIFVDEKMPALDEISPSYAGYSVGHWKDDTLVIETRGVREDVRFFDFPHSLDMKITERIKLTTPDHLENRIVVDDPQVLKKPYQFTFGYRKINYRIMEYVCDNNHEVADENGGVVLKSDQNKQP